MKTFLAIFCLFYWSVNVSAQVKALDALKAMSGAFTSAQQDTAKKKTTGTQSNLAVTDEGVPNEKKKDSKKTISGAMEKLKKKSSEAVNPGSGTGTSNLAVTDEGVPNDKKETGTENKTGPAGGTSEKNAELKQESPK